MIKQKRHRRTKAEMIAFRAEKAQKNINKYKEKIEKHLSDRNVSCGMKIIPWPPKELPDDNKFWEIAAVIGSESEMIAFYEKNKENCIAPPYLYECGNYRVTYWKEKTFKC